MIDLMATTPDGGVIAITVDADAPDHRGAYRTIPTDQQDIIEDLIDGQVDERGHIMSAERATAMGIRQVLDNMGWNVTGIDPDFETWDPDGPENDEVETTFSTFEG